MPIRRRVALAFLSFLILAACGDDDGPEPVGIIWGSGASGAFVGDTISLVVFYRDAAGDPIGLPRPSVTWTSSQPSVVAIISESVAVTMDTGRAVLTATTSAGPAYSVPVPFEVIPVWRGRLVWLSDRAGGQPVLFLREFPSHAIERLSDFGYPGQGHGLPSFNSDGSKLAAQATRPTGPGAPRTIYVVDLSDRSVRAPFDAEPGTQFAPVWLPGDTLLAFLAGAPSGWEVFTGRPDGSAVQQRTGLGQSQPPFFDATPDGTLILPLRPTIDLFELSLNGDTIRQVTSWTGQKAFPAVSPDGATIAFSAEGGANVWLVNRDGTNPRQLLPIRRVPISAFGTISATGAAPSWTPDGRFVLLQWQIDPTWIGDGYIVLSELYAIRVSDGLAIRLTNSPSLDGDPVFR